MVYFSYDDYVHPMERGQMPTQFPQKTLRGAPIPYYMAFPMNDGWDTEEENQRDYEYMRQMYPKRMQRIMEVIEDECDKLEYEGSMMFDEHPDRLMLAMLCDRIQQQVQDVEMEEVYEAMQRRPGGPGGSGMPGRPGMPGPGRPGRPGPGMPPPSGPGMRPPHRDQNNWLSDIIRALLFDEMHRRRSRHRNSRHRRMKF